METAEKSVGALRSMGFEVGTEGLIITLFVYCNREIIVLGLCETVCVQQATASKCDVRIKADVDAAILTAVKHFGGLDITVANAGERK